VVETEAGKEVESALLKEREKFERRMKENEEELQQALKDRDERAAQEALKMQDGFRRKINASTKAIEDMRVNLELLHEQKEEEFRREMEQMKAQRKMDEEKLRERGLQLELLAREIQTTTKANKELSRREKTRKEQEYQERRLVHISDTRALEARVDEEDRKRMIAAQRAGIIGATAGVGSFAVAAIPMVLLCSVM